MIKQVNKWLKRELMELFDKKKTTDKQTKFKKTDRFQKTPICLKNAINFVKQLDLKGNDLKSDFLSERCGFLFLAPREEQK